MGGQATILCNVAVNEVSVLEGYSYADTPKSQPNQTEQLDQDVIQEKQQITQDCELAASIVSALQKFSSETIQQYKDQVLNLAVKIAEKIIAVNIKQENYNLAGIITETLNCAPQAKEITVFLDNDDLQRVNQLQKQGDLWEFPSVVFKADPALNKAECRVETPKGTVNYIIEEHLEKINKALEQVC
ncbi:MAG: FliH/SctL family protein [Phycisphaerae bacterium]|nr:FliH/SctL family protein [Phycisphaerae bacterium]